MRSKLMLAAVAAALFVFGAVVPTASAQLGAYGRFSRGYSSYYGGYGYGAYSYGYRPYYAGYAAPYGYAPYYGGYSAGYAAPYGYGSYSYGYRPYHGNVYYYGW